MSYPPGNPGYPPASQQAPQYAATASYNSPQEPLPVGPSKLPQYLAWAVVVLGLGVYLASFGPLVSATSGGNYTPTLLSISIVVAVFAALLQGTGLLPKQKDPIAIVAALAVLALLLLILIVATVPSGFTIGWALYVVLALSLFQTIAAAWALLLEAGVVTAPVPRPKYEQPAQQYNPYGAGPAPYYGGPQQPQQPQQPHQPQQLQQPPHQAPPQTPQRPNYPPQYGGYPAGPTTVSFTPSTPLVSQNGPPTPPTGFPAYGQPQPSNQHQPTSVLPAQSAPQSPAKSESEAESTSSSPQAPSDDSAPPPS